MKKEMPAPADNMTEKTNVLTLWASFVPGILSGKN